MIDPLVAATFVAFCNVTATVRVFKSADCATAPVVMPVATVTVHSDPAANTAVVAVNVSVASATPGLAAVAVNPVDPHPLDVLTPAGDAIVNVGSTKSILSAVLVWSSGAFSSNVYEIGDSADVIDLPIPSVLIVSAATRTAVDKGTATALMFATPVALSVAAAVRVARFAFCAAPVVTPVATVTEHS